MDRKNLPMFKAGNRVVIYRKHLADPGWIPEMDSTIGLTGTIECVSQFSDGTCYNVAIDDGEHFIYTEPSIKLQK
jgi:hypothetical protein